MSHFFDLFQFVRRHLTVMTKPVSLDLAEVFILPALFHFLCFELIFLSFFLFVHTERLHL